MHPVSGLFHSPLGVLFTFPSRYLFTIGRSGVFSLGGWSPHIQTGFHVSRPTRGLSCFLPVRDYHPLRRWFPTTSSSYKTATGLIRVRSPLLTESRLMSFPPGTKMFQFPGFASTPYVFRCRYSLSCGFPHSDMYGSKLVRSSPYLIAAYHVLHRL
jgi:hypothetical protein